MTSVANETIGDFSVATDRWPAGRLAPPVPVDPMLPALRTVVDGAVLTEALQRRLPDAVVTAVPHYVRYKPHNKATVLCRVQVDATPGWAVVRASTTDLGALAARPWVQQLALRAATRTPIPPLLHLPELDVLFECYPLNHKLPGLVMEESLGAPAATLLGYKPEHRAVIGADGTIVKVYVRDTDWCRAMAGLVVAGAHLGSDLLVECDRTLRLIAQRRLPGREVPFDADGRASLGAALARLHSRDAGGSLTRCGVQDQLAGGATTAAHVAALDPDLGARTRQLLARLQAAPPPEHAVTAHGDFHHDQALVEQGEVASSTSTMPVPATPPWTSASTGPICSRAGGAS